MTIERVMTIRVDGTYLVTVRGQTHAVRLDKVKKLDNGRVMYLCTNLRNPRHKLSLGSSTRFMGATK